MIRPLPSLICLCAWTLSAEEIPLDPPVLWTPRDGTPVLLSRVDTLDHTRGELLEISQGIKDREALARLIKAVGQGRFKPGPAKGPGPLPESNGKAAIGHRKDGSPIFAEDLKGGADFRGAAFQKDTHFGAMDLRTLDFRGASLKEANLSLCQIDPAAFQGADLEGAKLPPALAAVPKPTTATAASSPSSTLSSGGSPASSRGPSERKASRKPGSGGASTLPTLERLFCGQPRGSLSRIFQPSSNDIWHTARIPLGHLEGGGPLRIAPLEKGLVVLSEDHQTVHILAPDFCTTFLTPYLISDICANDPGFWATLPGIDCLMIFTKKQASRNAPPVWGQAMGLPLEDLPEKAGRTFTQDLPKGPRFAALGESGKTLIYQTGPRQAIKAGLNQITAEALWPGPRGSWIIAAEGLPFLIRPYPDSLKLRPKSILDLPTQGLVSCSNGLAFPGPRPGTTFFTRLAKVEGEGQVDLAPLRLEAEAFVAEQAVDGPDGIAVFLSRKPAAIAMVQGHRAFIGRLPGSDPVQVCSSGNRVFVLLADTAEVLDIDTEAFMQAGTTLLEAPASEVKEPARPALPRVLDGGRTSPKPPASPAPDPGSPTKVSNTAREAQALEILASLFRFAPLQAQATEREPFPERLDVKEILLAKIARDHAAGTAYRGGKFAAEFDAKGIEALVRTLAASKPVDWEWQENGPLAAWYDLQERKEPVGKAYSYATKTFKDTWRVKVVYDVKAGSGKPTEAKVITAYPFPPKP